MGGVFLRCGTLSLGYNCTSWPCAKMVSTTIYAHNLNDVSRWCLFKSYMQTHWVLCIVSKICICSRMSPPSLNGIVYSVNFYIKCSFGMINFENIFTIQLIFTTIHGLHYTFGTIYGSHYTILTNFYFYLQYFQKKIQFQQYKWIQIDPKIGRQNQPMTFY